MAGGVDSTALTATPLTGELFTIVAGADSLTLTQTAVPSADVQQGASLKLLQVLDLSVDGAGDGTATLTDLTVTRLGTAVDADSTPNGVKLWHDVNDDAAWDGGDLQLGSSQSFSGGSATFAGLGFAVDSATPEKLLITVDVAVAGTSTEGNTMGSSINDAGDVVLASPDMLAISTPLDGNTHGITDSGDVLTVDQTSTGGGTVTKGTTNNVLMVLDLTSDNDSVTADRPGGHADRRGGGRRHGRLGYQAVARREQRQRVGFAR